MAEMEVLRQERQVLKDHESDIAANKKFTYEIKVPKIITHKLEGHQYVTNCLNCSFTCHFPSAVFQTMEQSMGVLPWTAKIKAVHNVQPVQVTAPGQNTKTHMKDLSLCM